MLLNLTNHPSEGWPENQRNEAVKRYQSILDWPFPSIPPALSSEELDNWVSDYQHKIIAIQPTAVHVMGEMTFCFRLIEKLKSAGIACIASTTERVTVQKENVKTAYFEFVQFRAY
ncbi:MAG: hypothetical protein ACK4UP_03355 [Spirosomataceae bacterium]